MPRPLAALSLALLLLLLSACGGRRIDTLQALPLPKAGIAPEVWQVLQTVRIDYEQEQISLTAVLAQQGDTLTLVLLDPLGRRLLSVQKVGDVVSSYRDPALPESLPDRFLLAAVQFVWWPPERWSGLSGSHWSITQIGSDRRLLSYRGEPVLSARFPEASFQGSSGGMVMAVPGSTVTLKHHRQPLSIVITTQQWQSL